MKLVGSAEQQLQHFLYDASGTITTGGTAQLVLPRHMSRSFFTFVNNSTSTMYLDFGAARATCVLSSKSISSTFTIANAGFGYTNAPIIRFYGGGGVQGFVGSAGPGLSGVSTEVGTNNLILGSTIAPAPQWPSPQHPAVAHAVLSGGAVNSIVLDDPGAGYLYAPLLFMFNSDLDPVGCAVPSVTAGAGGFQVVASGGALTFNGTVCPTDQCAVYCATTGAGFTCKYTT